MDLLQVRVTPDDLAEERRRPVAGEAEVRSFGFSVADKTAEQRDDGGDDDDGKKGLAGVASTFGDAYQVWDFDEVVVRGAFAKTLVDANSDKYAFWSHDSALVLGREQNKSLILKESDKGLEVEIFPPDTQVGRDAETLVRDGFVDKMSFGFYVIEDRWTKREGKRDLREILEAVLLEVSIVAFPANSQTSIVARGNGTENSGEGESDPADGDEGSPATSSEAERAKARFEFDLWAMKALT